MWMGYPSSGPMLSPEARGMGAPAVWGIHPSKDGPPADFGRNLLARDENVELMHRHQLCRNQFSRRRSFTCANSFSLSVTSM
jgi:hypothetical protein